MAAQEIGSLYLGLGFDTAVFDRQIVQIPAKVQQATGAITKGFAGASKELDNFQKSSGATRAGLQNLSFQLNDIGTSLASGSSPFRVLAQQGGQIVQVFQQAGFRNIAAAIVGMVTPMRALAAGAVAAGAAFGGLLLRAQSNSEQLRQFNLLLERTGRLASNLDVGGENARLRGLGISRDTAISQRLAIARNPTLNAGASERLQTLGANIGAFSGLGPEAGFQQMMQAISGGPEATIRFAASLGALSEQQAAALLSSARLTGGLKEQNQAIAALDIKMKGFAKEAMDPMTKATNALAGAWSNFITSLSQTNFVQNNFKFLTQQLQEIADVLSGKINLSQTSLGQEVSGPQSFPPRNRPGYQSPGQPGGAYFPFPTIDNPNAPPPEWRPDAGGAPPLAANPFATPEQFAVGRFWRSAGQMAATSRFRTGASGGPVVTARDPQAGINVADAIARQRQEIAAAARAQRLWNVEQEAALAAETARAAIRAIPGSTPDEQEAAATLAAAAARAKHSVELGKENTLLDMRVTAERKVAQAMLESEGASVRVNAAEQAKIETLQRGGDATTRMRQMLEVRSAAAETSLAQGVAQGKQETEVLQLRASLLGQSTEHIERQIALLRVRQQVEAAGVPVAQSVVDARLRGINALQDELDLLARQRKVMDTLREVAGVFENAFGRAFDSIASGTFKLRAFMGDLLKDLGKTLASSAFKRLLGGDDSGGGILGMIAGRLFPSLLSVGSGGGIGADYGGGGELGVAGSPGFATGGSFRVGGAGSLDSQLVAFRASPGEMVNVSPPGRGGYGGGAEIIRIDLNPSEGWVSGIADQRIVTRSGQIIDVAVRQSQKTVARNFAGMTAETQARQM